MTGRWVKFCDPKPPASVIIVTMVKLLHFADVHIGMENYGRTDPATGLSSRVMDFVHRLDDMIDHAREHDVDLAIFAGDAFKTRNPNPTYQREFAYRVQDLAALCPVVLLVGNHDLPTNARRASSVEVYETLRVPNVIVGMDYELHHIETKSGPVQVATAPYPVRARLLEDAPGGLRISELDARLQDTLHHTLEDLAHQAAQSDAPRVLTGHFTISGAVLGSERSVMLGRDVAALLSSVADPTWDYVAMGHIHKYQDMTAGQADRPPVVYSGSMERIDFGEEADPKGFVWVDLQRGDTQYDFIRLGQVRPFVTLRADLRASQDPTAELIALIDDYDLKTAVVRVIVTTTPESDALLKHKAIDEALRAAGADTVAGIQRLVERPERSRLGNTPEGLTQRSYSSAICNIWTSPPTSATRCKRQPKPSSARWTSMARAVWLGALLLSLVACGGSIDAPEQLPPDYQLVRGDGVALALPPDWQGFDPSPEDFRAVAASVADQNPGMAGRLEAMSAEIQDDTLRFIGLAPDGLTTVNVTSEGVPPFWNANAQASQNRDGLRDTGYDILHTDETTLNGQTAARTLAEIRVRQRDGARRAITIVQYTLVVGGRAYSLTFGTPSATYDDYAAQFDRIAQTFHTLD